MAVKENFEVKVETLLDHTEYVLTIQAPNRPHAQLFAGFLTTDQIEGIIKDPAKTWGGPTCTLIAARRA